MGQQNIGFFWLVSRRSKLTPLFVFPNQNSTIEHVIIIIIITLVTFKKNNNIVMFYLESCCLWHCNYFYYFIDVDHPPVLWIFSSEAKTSKYDEYP